METLLDTSYDEALTAVRQSIEQFRGCSPEERASLQQDLDQLNAMAEKLAAGRVEIVVFGEISTGKSALINALVGEAVAVTSLAGITGSASGGMSIALAAMAQTFIDSAHAAGIPMEVLHRIAAMASGGMDTLPHNGAVITLLAVTVLTHRQSYGDIFAITLISTASVFLAIAVYYLTGIV